MKELSQILHEYLMEIGMTDENTLILYVLILSLISLVGLYVIDFICKKIIRVVFIRFAKKSKSRFDDILITNRVESNEICLNTLIFYFFMYFHI